MELFKKEYIVGLDIGAYSVKMAQFIKKDDELYLVKVKFEEIPRLPDGSFTDSEVLPALRKALRGVDLKGSKFVVSINCPKTGFRKIVVPYMPREELREAISLEAKNYFPFPIDGAILDFEILGDTGEDGAKRHNVLIATSPRSTVNRYLSILDRVGVKSVAIIPASYALGKLYTSFEQADGEVECLLDIGEENTELVICSTSEGQRGDIVFSRKIPIAGRDFTKALRSVLASDKGRIELSTVEAEEIKKIAGIPAQGETGMVEGKMSTVQILSLFRSPLEQLVNEIDRCLDSYREETGSARIDSLMLFGAGSSLRGLPAYLSEGLDIEVKVGNSLDNLKMLYSTADSKAALSNRFSLAIGAALSYPTRGVNLLPPKISAETKQTVKRLGIEVIATMAILFISFIYVGMRIQLGNFQKRIRTGRMELRDLGPQLEHLEEQSFINNILAAEPYWDDILRVLSNIVPQELHLTEISIEAKAIKMRGVIMLDEKEQLLSEFILSLKKELFKNVDLVMTDKVREDDLSEFEIQCDIH